MIYSLSQFNQLTIEQINRLLENKVPESKTLDYKECLKTSDYEDKKEILADISSFANTEGGVIIWGIKEDKGIPTEITGVEISDPDSEILKIDNLLRDCLEPRIQGTILRPLHIENNKYIFMIYIPKSFNPPHVVKIGGHWRFYSRNSAGKYSLEVSELKSLITLSSSVREKIRNFRIERISKIKNQDIQVPISTGPQFIYHIIPLSSFATDSSIDLAKFEYGNIRHELFDDLIKIFNYEGILIHNHMQGYVADWYTQIFRNGAIEVFTSRFHHEGQKILFRNDFEKGLLESIPRNIATINFFEINTPFLLFQSVLNIKGYKIKLNEFETMRELSNHPFIKNDLILPEVLIDDETLTNLPFALKPLFDPIWNAAGHPQSPNYNEKGEWTVK